MWNLSKSSNKARSKANIETLVSMGFTRSQATNALEAFNNNLEEATNHLLSLSSLSSSSSPASNDHTGRSGGAVQRMTTSTDHLNETEDEQLQRIMAESIQLEENRKAVAASATSKASSKASSTSRKNTSAASLKAGQAAAARAAMANRRFGANGKIIPSKQEKKLQSQHPIPNIEKYRPQQQTATSFPNTIDKTAATTHSELQIDKTKLKDHPNVKMPVQMKDKSKEEQILRCVKRLSSHPHAVDTLLRAFRFIRQNPDNDKYRKIDRSTIGFQNALEGKPGAIDLIKAMNFVQRPNSMDLVLHRDQVDIALLYLGESALEEVRKSEEYVSKKNIMVFEKELKKILNGENVKEDEEIVNRAAFVSKLPTEPQTGAGAVMQVTLGSDTTITRRFDGDDMLRDVVNFIGGHGSLIPEKIFSREWCLVDLNRYPIVPINTEDDMTKTLQYIGCWPSGKLALKPSPQEWREKKELLEKAGSSRGLGALS